MQYSKIGCRSRILFFSLPSEKPKKVKPEIQGDTEKINPKLPNCLNTNYFSLLNKTLQPCIITLSKTHFSVHFPWLLNIMCLLYLLLLKPKLYNLNFSKYIVKQINPVTQQHWLQRSLLSKLKSSGNNFLSAGEKLYSFHIWFFFFIKSTENNNLKIHRSCQLFLLQNLKCT